MKEKNIIFSSRTNRSILIYLNKKVSDYTMNVSREIKYIHGDVVDKFKELKNYGLIEKAENKKKKRCFSVEEDVRRKYFKLTKKGKKIAGLLLEIDQEVRDEK